MLNLSLSDNQKGFELKVNDIARSLYFPQKYLGRQKEMEIKTDNEREKETYWRQILK